MRFPEYIEQPLLPPNDEQEEVEETRCEWCGNVCYATNYYEGIGNVGLCCQESRDFKNKFKSIVNKQIKK